MQIHGLKVAVTGGAGFIGSHLVDLLVAKKNHVVVIDNFATGRRENLAQHAGKSDLVQIIEGDVRDVALLERAFKDTQVVFHLATHCVRLSLTEPSINHEVNATGTLNALLAARTAGVRRFLYCSSSEVYGNSISARGAEGVLDEDSPKLPTTVYGASKLVGEHYALAFHQTYGLEAIVARPFNSYGPRSHYEGAFGEVIPRFAIWVRSGQAPVIFGDGTQTRDFTYVEDTAACLIKAAEADSLLGSSVNLAHGEEVMIRDIAKIICELSGRDFTPRHVEDRPGDIQRLGADVTRMKRSLQIAAPVAIREGLSRYLSWLDGQNLDYAKLARALTDKNWNK